ncbi:acyl-CoA dehydrogenase family protein [Nocardia sp. NPDC050799]|uniref:acyl-CoA dehydrogenase family protein n=1 Tax=Nocardia sp. NPDC050799 TaxID=3154842 RepID=UPI0033F03837
MFIDLTPEEEALRAEAEAYFATALTAAEKAGLREDETGAAHDSVVARLGRDGWLGRGWPTEFGGEGIGPVAEQTIVSTAYRHRVLVPFATVFAVGLSLQQFGTPQQLEEFLPRIRSGRIHIAIGYSEPGAGTDLAALTTVARREGDEYVIRGQKMWTSGVHNADYIWLACRTDPSRERHRGVSIILVDTLLPGISWTPVHSLNGARHLNALYLDDVRVPVRMLVGEENRGWEVITHQLNAERFNAGPAGKILAHLDTFRVWAQATVVDGGPAADLPDVRRAVAEFEAIATTNLMLNWRSVSETGAGDVGPVHASVNKIFTSERILDVARRVLELVHRYGDPAEPATITCIEDTAHAFKTELKLPVGGGVSEVQRELIAHLGLGLPRGPR